MIKVLHVITDLGQGGAEAVTFRLIARTRERFQHAVVSLHQEGIYGPRLRELGVPVTALGMSRGRPPQAAFRALRRLMQAERPDVVQTRMYHADLAGGWAARFRGGPPVLWAVHSTELASWRVSWMTRIVRRLCVWASTRYPVRTLTDARATARLHERLGYPPLTVIPNGVDADVFKPDPDAGQALRRAWDVAPGETLIGCVARWDPLKDHDNLLGAVAVAIRRGVGLRCVLAGGGMTRENPGLMRLIEKHGVAASVICVGPQNDVPAVMNALDVHVLSSFSESQPVAVMEAMACGTPGVVTDVGDAATVVGDTGWIVPPKNAAALGDAIVEAVRESRTPEWQARRAAARARAQSAFSLARMADDYAAQWTQAAAGGTA